jgi:hypothetical protein
MALFNRRRKLADVVGDFFGRDARELPIVSRTFSSVDLPNLQLAFEGYSREHQSKTRVVGYVGGMVMHETLSELIGKDSWFVSTRVGPVRYRMVDVDVDQRMECVEAGVHLIDSREGKIAAHVREGQRSTTGGLELEVMTPDQALAAAFIDEIRERAYQSNVYRGKIISLGVPQDPMQMMMGGCSLTVAFHRMPAIRREEVILPEATMTLLERNTLRFLQHADVLRRSGRSVKRGLLLHGKPGTGKTYTAKWLAQSLPEVTTILLTGEQLWLIRPCCQIARLLAPSLVIMEDVDLIATERDERRHPAYQITLHQLLNEMDGLASDAEVIFLLTTNRPQALEPALAARPGRIDQAIEFPLPDAECRRRLLELYGRGLTLSLDDPDRLIARMEGASPAFVQELVRKSALIAAEEGSTDDGSLRLDDHHFDLALQELLLGGGELTRNLLGFKMEEEKADRRALVS